MDVPAPDEKELYRLELNIKKAYHPIRPSSPDGASYVLEHEIWTMSIATS